MSRVIRMLVYGAIACLQLGVTLFLVGHFTHRDAWGTSIHIVGISPQGERPVPAFSAPFQKPASNTNQNGSADSAS